VSSSNSSAFPPAPTSASGVVKPSISPVSDLGFGNAFRPQQKTASSARPVSAVDGLPVLPPVPESQPFSLDQAFSPNISSAPAATAVPSITTPSQPPSVPDAPNPSFDDAFGLNGAQTDSGFGTTSSRTSSIPLTQSPVTAFPTNAPIQGITTTSPRDTISFPVSSPHGASQVSSPPRVASPKGRPSTSSSKESGKEPGRHSKLSVS
jgi:hypothetical protein